MRQFLLPPDWGGGSRLELSGKNARRLVAVLRLRAGDHFPAMGPDGRRFDCTVLSAGRDGLVASVAEAGDDAPAVLPDLRAGAAPRAAAAEPRGQGLPAIVLAVGLLKGTKLDEVARAAAEAGVSTLIPLHTERSVPRGQAPARMDRLSRIVAEALGQSGSPVATRVNDPLTLAELAASYPPRPGRLLLTFHETPLAENTLHRYCSSEPDEIVACVGPEGGFSDAELSLLSDGGFAPAWLGPNVLRAETAAVFAAASLRIVCLERLSWSMKK